MDQEIVTKVLKDNKKYFKHAGGDVETFLSKCKMVHAKRIIGLDKVHKFVLTGEDLRNGIELVKKHKKIKEVSKPPMGLYI